MTEGSSYGMWLEETDSKDGIQGPYHSSVSDEDHPIDGGKWRSLC